MQAAVVLFPGSNADSEMVNALRSTSGVSVSEVWHKDGELAPNTDLVAIPGGFSYGDYLRPGAIAKASRIVGAIRRHAERGGLVLGVCNGFQVLTEMRLLPGALVQNQHLRFECSDVWVTVTAEGPFTTGMLGRALRLPVAHAEGRYHADPPTVAKLERDELVAFRYTDRTGQPGRAHNVNGSVAAIAGVYGGPKRNVLGLMPHPERATDAFLRGDDGRKLFESVARWHAGQA